MRRDPFARASRRIIRRLGNLVPVFVTAPGTEPRQIEAVFDNPEGDRISKGAGGALVLTSRQPRLLVLTDDVLGISKDWRLTVAGVEYYPGDHRDDGHGVTGIPLMPADSVGEVENGTTWR